MYDSAEPCYSTETEKHAIDHRSVGRPINPLHNGISQALCKQRSDTALPCPLIWFPKNNTLCESRHFTGTCPDVGVIVDTILAGGIVYTALDGTLEGGNSSLVFGKKCDRPGCDEMTKRGKHCGRCATMCSYWAKKWERLHPGEPCPDEYLYQWADSEQPQRIAETNRANASGSRSFGTRANTYEGGKCSRCGGRERYVSNEGCVACARRRSDEQRLRRHNEIAMRRLESVGMNAGLGR